MEHSENKEYIFDDDTNRIQEFAVRFFDKFLRIDDVVLPIGQVSTEILNLPDSTLIALHSLSDRLNLFLGRAMADKRKKRTRGSQSSCRSASTRCKSCFTIFHPYSYMQIDKDFAHHAWIIMSEDNPKDFREMFIAENPKNKAFKTFLNSMVQPCFEMSSFKGKARALLEVYIEPLKKRNPSAYAALRMNI